MRSTLSAHNCTRRCVYVRHCGQVLESVETALDRDYFMTPEQAKDWGLIDKIAEKRAEPEKG